MFRNRIEIESSEKYQERYSKTLRGWQKTYEFFWELQSAFGERLFGGFVSDAEKEWQKISDEGIGRRRFFRLAGSIRIPLTSIPAVDH